MRFSSRPLGAGASAGGLVRLASQHRVLAAAVALVALLLVVLLVNVIVSIDQKEAAAQNSVFEAVFTSAQEGAAEAQAALEAQRAAEEAAKVRTGAPPGVGIEDPWVDTGWFTTGDAELDQWIKELCSDNDVDSASWENAYKTYPKVAWAEYVERDNNQEPIGDDWRLVYAKQFFESGYAGNCYEFAAAVQYMLQYYGYSDAHAEAVLVELQSGGMGDHGLCFVTDRETGRACFVDTSLGLKGWMLDEDAYNYRLNDFSQQDS